MAKGRWKIAVAAAVGLVTAGLASSQASAAPIDFSRDVRPILSNHCFHCHGPDPETREAGLRLDVPAEAFAVDGGRAAIVPGDPDASEIIARITSDNPHAVMPPPELKKPLDEAQIAILRQWITDGAEWPEHWAFTPPEAPPLPAVPQSDWVQTPVDAFVLARLDREGLAPSSQADALTLLRRLHLDLTGLPPTPEDIERFQSKALAEAYDEAVETLLNSPHFGEHWAREWLDAAQYADSDGFEKDKPRMVWAWRDWVINALNDNMPYDQFLREQIAGDLLPDADRDTIVATGFLRNSMINEEGGIDPEQFRMEAVFNRVDVVGRAVLGLTMQCAQCHTHKFDPISHTEYFQFLSYFNNSNEANITVLSDAEEAQAAAVLDEIAAAEDRLKENREGWAESLAAWEEGIRAVPAPEWRHFEMTFDDTASGGQKFTLREDGAYLSQGYAPTRFAPKMAGPSPVDTITAIRLDLLTDPDLPRGGPGRSIFGTAALSEFEFRLRPKDAPYEQFDQWERVAIDRAIADVNPPRQAVRPAYRGNEGRDIHTGPVAYAIDGDGNTAWSTDLGAGRSNVDRHAIFFLPEALALPPDTELAFRLHQQHGGNNSNDNQVYSLGAFRISVTDAPVLPEVAVPTALEKLIRQPEAPRTDQEQTAIFRYWRENQPQFALDNLFIETLWAKYPWGTTQLVYQERETPRVTHRLDRGDFLSPAEPVTPGVPAALHPMPEDAPPNRLGLAQWLTDPQAVTTARVYVNRIWQRYFSTGLVETADDFGVQGAAPSHPELLDWLAVQFVDSGWDVKGLHRLIVHSATYQQEAAATPELLERDPDNRLLARASRFRVEGEVVRDIALSASGLLYPEVGGPSVYPPAPEFLFQAPASYGDKYWPIEEGPDQYRRGLYIFRYRSVPHPVLQAFDTPPGDAPCTGRQVSNSPLQPLVTMNEPMFVEAARELAAQTLAMSKLSDRQRLAHAFLRCTTRVPEEKELDTLQQFLNTQRARLAAGELNADTIVLTGDTQETPDADAAEWAAWTLTARVLLNLDETLSRP